MAVKDWFSARRKQGRGRYISPGGAFFTGIALLVVGVALFATLIELWPVVDRGEASVSQEIRATLLLGLYKGAFQLSTALILLSIVAGALGAYIHAATSFVSFVGNRTFKTSWLWWYGLRLPIGSALAVVLYFTFRGGLLPGYDATDEISPYGVAALSAFAGLFSKQATDKLKEIFDVMFRTPSDEGDDARADKLDERRPQIERFDPPRLKVGDRALTVLGERFEEKAKVFVGGDPRTTAYVSAQKLTVELEADDTKSVGSLKITVSNPPPGEPTSDAKTIEVVAA